MKIWRHMLILRFSNGMMKSPAVRFSYVLFFFAFYFLKKPLNGVLRSKHNTQFLNSHHISSEFFFCCCLFVYCIQYAQYVQYYTIEYVLCSIFHCVSLEFCNWRTYEMWIIYNIIVVPDDNYATTIVVWHFKIACFSL